MSTGEHTRRVGHADRRRGEAAGRHRAARGDRRRPRPARRSLGRGANAPAHGRRRRLRPRRRAAPPLHEGEAEGGAGREHPRRRGHARRHRHPRPARAAGVHDAERLPAEGLRAGGRRERGRARPTEEQHCYVCKQPYRELHHFYDQLCPPCAAFNFAKRSETADLEGRVAVLTGGRVKIGYQAGIKLLRAGAHLIVTTRFPRDSAARYAQEPDFGDWGDRLEIYGLDLRHTPSVEAFCHHLLATHDRLDYIVNNACQTVRRPPDFYRHMLEAELASEHSLAPEVQRLLGDYTGVRRYDMLESEEPVLEAAGLAVLGSTTSAELSQVRLLPEEAADQGHLFPEGRLDQDLQQVDLRDRNSWRFLLAEVSTVELLETQLVNAVAPFVLNARLKPLHAAHGRPRQAHRQRLGGGGAVLPPLQDHPPPAHEHGEGGAEHDDAHRRDRLPRRRHPHEQRRHRLGHRRGPAPHRGAEDGRAPLPAAARHRRRRRPDRRPDHRRHEHRRRTCGASSSRTTGRPTGRQTAAPVAAGAVGTVAA